MTIDEVIATNPNGVCCDSRLLKTGEVYVSIKGENYDGDSFALETLKNGASFVITSRESHLPEHAQIIRVGNTRKALAKLCSHVLQPKPGTIVAVTGTSGKTSVAYLYYQIAKALGFYAGYIGTLGVMSNDDESAIESGASVLTSPDAVSLNRVLMEMALKGVAYVAIEASSHGLDQHRIDYIPIKAAAFTNFSQDHLDYHQSMAEYFTAKKRLFAELLSSSAAVVLNCDIPQYAELVAASDGYKVIEYGHHGHSIKITNHGIDASSFSFGSDGEYSFSHKLMGDFQAYNLAAAIGLGIASGWDISSIMPVIPTLKAAPGRLEYICSHKNAKVFLDYAHKPDALEKVLSVLRRGCNGRLIVVFGCGGDRDKGKRPIMGSIAANIADLVIVTDDNPRSEEAGVIRGEIMSGCPGALECGDRSVAIKTAMHMLQSGDVLLVAGKGHEDYQIIGNQKMPFSDKKEILQHVTYE